MAHKVHKIKEAAVSEYTEMIKEAALKRFIDNTNKNDW